MKSNTIMTASYRTGVYQDSIAGRNVAERDSVRSVSDSVSDSSSPVNTPDTGSRHNFSIQGTDPAFLRDSFFAAGYEAGKQSGILKQAESRSVDTTSLCRRNAIADVTFYQPDFIISSVDSHYHDPFPVLFTENTVQIQAEKKAAAEKNLRPGENLPQQPFHDDWVLGIILLAIILFSLVQASSKSILPRVTRFFLLRGTKEEVSRYLPGIFHWQSTILNLSSFMITALFAYFAASFYELIPARIPGFTAWLIMICLIIIAITLRHIICVGTGTLSGQDKAFLDYLHTVYQSYRFGAFFLFVLVVLMEYTSFLSFKSYFIIGAIFLISMYLLSILRLFIIFINRNISIFYLILYLCALEFLPVLILIKYFSGLE